MYIVSFCLRLGAIGLNHFMLECGKLIRMINTPKFDNEKEYLFTVKYTDVCYKNRKEIRFYSHFMLYFSF